MMEIAAPLGALLIAAGGLAFILQNRQLGGFLLLAGIACVALAPFAGQILPALQIGILLVVAAALLLAALRGLLTASVGRRAAGDALGILAADTVRFMFLLPFRLVGGLFRIVFGREGGGRGYRARPQRRRPRRQRW